MLKTCKPVSDNIIINQKPLHLCVQFKGLELYSTDNDLNLKEKLYPWLYPTRIHKNLSSLLPDHTNKREKIGRINFNKSCVL